MTVETGNIKTADMIIGCYEYVSTTTYQDALIRGFPNRIDVKIRIECHQAGIDILTNEHPERLNMSLTQVFKISLQDSRHTYQTGMH